MTPSTLAHLRSSTLDMDREYHIQTRSGNLFTGKILDQDQDIVTLEVANLGPMGVDNGMHKVWLAIEDIEAIEERS